MAEAEHTVSGFFEAGRSSPHRAAAGPDRAASAGHPYDAELAPVVDRYERLGAEPPHFNVAHNDDEHRSLGAHTLDRHRPDMPLQRDPNTQTVEGRIYGDDPWPQSENWSHRWTDPTTMHQTINDYVERNWETIRSDLALEEEHNGSFDAGHRVGLGYYNDGMFGAGPRLARYSPTSFVRIRIRLVPGSDPPEPFILTAFPTGLM